MYVVDVLHGQVKCNQILRQISLNVPRPGIINAPLICNSNIPMLIKIAKSFNDIQDHYDFPLSKEILRNRLRQ